MAFPSPPLPLPLPLPPSLPTTQVALQQAQTPPQQAAAVPALQPSGDPGQLLQIRGGSIPYFIPPSSKGRAPLSQSER